MVFLPLEGEARWGGVQRSSYSVFILKLYVKLYSPSPNPSLKGREILPILAGRT